LLCALLALACTVQGHGSCLLMSMKSSIVLYTTRASTGVYVVAVWRARVEKPGGRRRGCAACARRFARLLHRAKKCVEPSSCIRPKASGATVSLTPQHASHRMAAEAGAAMRKKITAATDTVPCFSGTVRPRGSAPGRRSVNPPGTNELDGSYISIHLVTAPNGPRCRALGTDITVVGRRMTGVAARQATVAPSGIRSLIFPRAVPLRSSFHIPLSNTYKLTARYITLATRIQHCSVAQGHRRRPHSHENETGTRTVDQRQQRLGPQPSRHRVQCGCSALLYHFH
jgi:hypothetical protein